MDGLIAIWKRLLAVLTPFMRRVCPWWYHVGTEKRETRATEDVQVLIIGGGPTGLLTAALLTRLGVQCLIIERHPSRLTAPKAHALGPRSFDIFRQFGFDVPLIRRRGTSRESGRWVNFVTTLAGDKLGELPYERMDTDVLDHTPEMFHNVPQPAVEDIIRDVLSGSVEIRKNHSFVACSQTDGHVYCTVEDRLTGRNYLVKSRYLIACDGAKSKVRQSLGIQSDGEQADISLMTIEIDANLRSVVKDKLAILYWIINPEVHGTIIGYDLSEKQVMTCNFDPEKLPISSWDMPFCRKIINSAIGADIPYTVRSFRPWIMKRQVAQTYQQGNVFLAGDAAHSFPPSAGIGLNSAIGDVHNLCWKLAGVVEGWAKDALLPTYTTERRYIAEVNSTQSVRNGKKIYDLIKQLSFSDLNPEAGWEAIRATLDDPVQRKAMMNKIQGLAANFDNLELHIGYVYGTKSVPGDPSAYTPKYIPGARLPHLWVKPLQESIFQGMPPVDLSYIAELSADDRKLRQFSTLDICSFGSFTLIVNSDPDQEERCQRLIAILNERCNGRVMVPLRIAVLGVDFEIVFSSKGEDWVQQLNLTQGSMGGVLVRPDQHILTVLDGHVSASGLASILLQSIGH